ncbi:Imm50 family immunity protein [Bradyrhizobium sp. LTSPM299]|uniref:Imm50 family immunity protein n=1 Tax=Bradyrhizobium sp. LTSPM299 TaxID=1619233 RepID=UPI001FD930CF|nr:Imm50 family immunity protein [Bradyrhizobium sp. LTSPM299]
MSAIGGKAEILFWNARPEFDPLQTSNSDGSMVGMTTDNEPSIYDEVPGGVDLVRWFGRVPSFHDAEILSLRLHRKGPSALRLHGWINTGEVGHGGYFVLHRHAVVTITLSEVMDLQLDNFSIQNVISGLVLRRAPNRPERRGYLTDPRPQDIEIELEPCYGLSGLIRARAVSIVFEPGEPAAQDIIGP